MSFETVDSRLFFSRHDAQDPRLGDYVRRDLITPTPSALEKALRAESVRSFVIAGYPDDEGIQINGGRLGAALAPDSVRKPLYKMTPPLFPSSTSADDQKFSIIDLGNLKTSSFALGDRHSEVTEFGKVSLNAGATWIGIGGGHDYGFPDAAAYIQWAKAHGERPLVLNFDAHLDVRPVSKGLSSGTPFFRMLEAYPEVDFAEIGIQGHCNSRTHLEWAKSRGARILTQEQVMVSGESFTTHVMRLLGDWILKSRSVFLSIDIDGFSSAIAPGCSQSWATGFSAQDFFPCLDVLTSRLDVRMLGIYEVSPPLDSDDRTSKLAAQIVHKVLA